MRRICCFCESWESGGIESFLKTILCSLNFENIEVDVVSAHIGESVFATSLKGKGVRFFELSGEQRNYLTNFRMFRELLRRRNYDVVHFNLFQGISLFYARIAQKENVPVRIVHSHGAGLRNSRTKMIKLVLHRIGSFLWAKAATDRWACSSAAADFLFARTCREAEIIPNGIDTQRLRFQEDVRDNVRKKLGLSNRVIIGTVGRMSREKNQAFALTVFSKFHQSHPESYFVLVGDGEEREMLKKHAQNLGIENAVTFLGSMENVEQLLCAMDLFLFPSYVEGLGIAVIEAQASGLPVLCSDRIPAEARLTSRLTAMPLRAGPDAWNATMEQLLLKKKTRESSADEVRAAGFDVEDVAKQIEKKYMGSCYE